MKNILETAGIIFITLFVSGNLFVCLICGPSPDATIKYLISAAGVSVLLPGFACACVFYIRYLNKKQRDYEKRENLSNKN